MSQTAGWHAPAVLGPRRGLVLRIFVAAAIFVFAAWAYGAHAWDAHGLRAGESQEIRAAAAVPATKGLYVRGGRIWVARRVDVPGSRTRHMSVSIASPAGVASSDVSLRAWSDGGTVRLRRNSLDEPVAELTRHRGSAPLHLLIVRPATEGEATSSAAKSAPRLISVTEVFDRRVATSQLEAGRLADVQGAAPWVVPLLVLLAGGGPLLVAWVQRRRWLAPMVPPRAATTDVTGPPASGAALAGALATLGTGAIDAERAFAGQLLELVDAGVIDARRVHDAQQGASVMLRVARRPADDAPELVRAAVAVVDLHTPKHATSLLVADRPSTTVDAAARTHAAATWLPALASAQRTSGQVESPAWNRWLRVGQFLSMMLVVVVVLALRAGDGGSAARWWTLLGAVVALAYAVRQIEQEVRTWRRVPVAARVLRTRWLAWRDVLAARTAEERDVRSTPYVVAVGIDDELLLPDVAPVGALGVAAFTSRTVAGLARLVSMP